MLNEIQAVILGIVQGLSEFLPISSSGHLILVREVFHFPDPGKTFDIMMHLGTLIALIVYFWGDLVRLFSGFFRQIVKEKKAWGTLETDMVWFIVISTIPGGILGLLYNDWLESIRNVYLISSLLIVFGVILWIVDRKSPKSKTLDRLTAYDALIIGVMQALALFPGVSRSGISMTAVMLLGFTREDAARYSFLISIPLIGGTSIYGLAKIISSGPDSSAVIVLALGVAASFISGLLCIKFLLDFLKKRTFNGFVIYRVLLGLFLILWSMMGRIN